MANKRISKADVAGEEQEAATLVGGELDLQTEINRLIAKGDDGEYLNSTGKAKFDAIANGDIVARIGKVQRKVENKPYAKQYLQLVPVTLAGCQAIMPTETTWDKTADDGNGDFDGPCFVKDFFYGNDLNVKARESQALARDVEGPDKAFASAAKQLAKALNITEEEALKRIKAMPR